MFIPCVMGESAAPKQTAQAQAAELSANKSNALITTSVRKARVSIIFCSTPLTIKSMNYHSMPIRRVFRTKLTAYRLNPIATRHETSPVAKWPLDPSGDLNATMAQIPMKTASRIEATINKM